MNKHLVMLAAAAIVIAGPQKQNVAAQPYRLGDILYGSFKKQNDGILRSTYSVRRSDIVGYGVAFDCVNLKVNMYAPDGMPGSPGVRWRWVGWEDESSTEHSKMFWQQCRVFYKEK